MSRHRNVRSMNYEEEFYDDDDEYSKSVEDNYCISPSTAAQFTWNQDKARNLNFAAYMQDEAVIDEEEEEEESLSRHDSLSESATRARLSLSEVDQARLNSCLEEVRNILGESVSESVMIEVIIENQFNLESSLNKLLSQQDAPKPQRVPRQRRNRAQEAEAEQATGFPHASSAENTSLSETAAPALFLTLPTPSASKNPETVMPSVASSKATIGFQQQTAASEAPSSVSFQSDSKTNEPKKQSLSAVQYMSITKSGSAEGASSGSKKSYPLISGKSKSDSASYSMSRNRVADESKDVVDGGAGGGGATASAAANLSSAVEFMGLEGDQEVIQSSVEGLKPAVASTPKSKSKGSKIDVMSEYAKRHGDKELLNLVVIGHVDAGKSTLMGHLLYQLGSVNKKTMHKYEQESKKMGKSSFAFAWVLDETEEERTRGVTMDVAQTRFETAKKMITVLDAPGHKDFIPNMITGASQADVAMLVINAARGEFETGFDAGGQTREHALLARSLGVGQIIVAVNKMDTIDWSQERYDLITKKIGQFLYRQAGFKETDVSFVPCSGLVGQNLTQRPTEEKLTSWYKPGVTLMEQIDKLRPPTRPIDKPFRLNVSDVFKAVGSGFNIAGRVGSGYVQPGDKVLVLPASISANVKNVYIDDIPVQVAFAGDHVNITMSGVDMANVNIGSALCDPSNPSKSATRIRAKIVIFNIALPITKGCPVVFHYQSINEPAMVKRLISQLNRSTGEVIKKKPRCLVKNTSAVVEIELERAMCLELYTEFKDLGRFMLRQGGHTIAAGVVEEIVQSKTPLNGAGT